MNRTTTSTSSAAARLPRSGSPQGRLGVASRVVAAVFGGYALASFFSITLTLASRAPREEAIAGATPLAFLAFAGAVLWAFAARSATRAWFGIATPTFVLVALSLWLRSATP